MRNATHEAIGCAAAAGACVVVGADIMVTAGCMLSSILGSRLPDSDKLGAKIHRKTRIERRVPVLGILGFVARIPMKLFALLATHRGSAHWLITGVLIAALCGYVAAIVTPALAFPVTIGLACGYLAHTLADSCTPHGSPLLGPFRREKVHLLPKRLLIQTGSFGDMMICVAALSLTAFTLTVLGPA